MIENYKNLLLAIFNTDQYEDKKSVICAYDVKENGMIVGIFNTSKSCAKFFGTTPKSIDCFVCRKRLKKDRFLLERVQM